MKNKTCEKCLYYNDHMCDFNAMKVQNTRIACIHFDPKEKPLTNGDKIRSMSNRELAEDMVYEIGSMWASTLIVDTTFETYEEAISATLAWLNAPAESEVDND